MQRCCQAVLFVKQRAAPAKPQLLEGHPRPQHTLRAIAWLQLHIKHLDLQACQLKASRQMLQLECLGSFVTKFSDKTGVTTLQQHAAHMLAMLAKVRQQAVIQLLLCPHVYCDATECHHSCLVQPAVCPGSAEQAGGVVYQTLQHCQ